MDDILIKALVGMTAMMLLWALWMIRDLYRRLDYFDKRIDDRGDKWKLEHVNDKVYQLEHKADLLAKKLHVTFMDVPKHIAMVEEKK